MGWNGGGFGHMTFETPGGVAAWKAANVSHDQWADWADWFERPVAPRFIVEQQLDELRKLHDPKGAGYFVLDEQDSKVDFAFDTGEDTVRDFSGTIAAVLRAAAEHGARGTFYFLGTAGAEYDFTYKLELANGFSTMETLNEHDIATVYEGDQYQTFLARVMEALGVTADGELVDHAGTLAKTIEPAPIGDDDAEREALKTKAAAFSSTLQKAQQASRAEPAVVETAEDAPATVEAADSDDESAGDESAVDESSEPMKVKPAAANKPVAKAAAKPAAKAAAKPAAKAAAKPAAKKPAAKAAKPAAKKAAAKKPAAKKPAAKKAVAKPANKPAAKKAAAKKPASKKPAAKKPAAKKPAAKKK